MNIPEFTWLMGMKITTEFDSTLCARKKLVGEADYRQQKIVLDNSVCTQEILEQSYLHELVHWILFLMNRQELRNDEDFVDTFAHLIYQANIMQYNEIKTDEARVGEDDKDAYFDQSSILIELSPTVADCSKTKSAATRRLADLSEVSVGMKVRHTEYGVGNIVNVEWGGFHQQVIISFDSKVQKKYPWRYSELEYIEGEAVDKLQKSVQSRDEIVGADCVIINTGFLMGKKYDPDGYNRDGYNRDGFDKEGYDRDGYDWYDFSREGVHFLTCTSFDQEGYDWKGYNSTGHDKYARHIDIRTAYEKKDFPKQN